MRISSVAFYKLELIDRPKVDGDTTSIVRISDEKSCAGAESLETKLCGSLNKNSSNRVVEGKFWSISLAVTEERNEKKVISALRFAGSETNMGLSGKARNPTS